MENTVGTQVYSLFLFIITGIIIGAFFDIFRILRRTFKTPDWITYLEDILFWILTGSLLLFVLFYFQKGEIRAYIIIGLFFGTLIYMLTISKYFMKASVLFLTKLKNIISKVFLWLAKPLSLLGKALHMICMKPVSFMVINVKKIFLQFHNNNIFTLKNKKIKNKKKESIKKCRKL